jgi:hypothetical protein
MATSFLPLLLYVSDDPLVDLDAHLTTDGRMPVPRLLHLGHRVANYARVANDARVAT